jgi:hypothetical protein
MIWATRWGGGLVTSTSPIPNMRADSASFSLTGHFADTASAC